MCEQSFIGTIVPLRYFIRNYNLLLILRLVAEEEAIGLAGPHSWTNEDASDLGRVDKFLRSNYNPPRRCDL